MVFDPGDNSLEQVGHVWNGKAREIPIHFGTRRPTLVLQPAGVFTVTGAVVIAPAGLEPRPPRIETTVASDMPDLTQSFNPRWPGLCGPTSAADTLYAMHAAGRRVLDGFASGPGPEGDAAVERLVAGGEERIAADSLAGRMQIGTDGDGATNLGLRDGCRSWLLERDPGSWKVDLLWFDDKVKDHQAQRTFVGQLAAALHSGGGAILCLWPGSEFADGETGEPSEDPPAAVTTDVADSGTPTGTPPLTERDQARQTVPGNRPSPRRPDLPAAEFPILPAAPTDGRRVLPGGSSTGDTPEVALAKASDKRRAAETRMRRGEIATAVALATQGIELLVGPARRNAACREELDRLLDLCAAAEARMPARPAARTDLPTEYR